MVRPACKGDRYDGAEEGSPIAFRPPEVRALLEEGRHRETTGRLGAIVEVLEESARASRQSSVRIEALTRILVALTVVLVILAAAILGLTVALVFV